MSNDLAARLEVIRQKIITNKAMVLGPCLSEEELSDFEQSNHITLPKDYREFLKSVGNGVDSNPENVDEGAWEIFSLGKTSWGILSKPFPFTEVTNYVDGDIEEAPGQHNGQLEICHVGCGTVWILIVTGAERGHMWIRFEGFFPSNPRISFLEWCEQWADHGYTDGLEDLALEETSED